MKELAKFLKSLLLSHNALLYFSVQIILTFNYLINHAMTIYQVWKKVWDGLLTSCSPCPWHAQIELLCNNTVIAPWNSHIWLPPQAPRHDRQVRFGRNSYKLPSKHSVNAWFVRKENPFRMPRRNRLSWPVSWFHSVLPRYPCHSMLKYDTAASYKFHLYPSLSPYRIRRWISSVNTAIKHDK